MQLKTRDEIQAEINSARGLQGFAADDGTAADAVMAACTPIAGMYAGVEAIPFPVIIALALQIIPIIFGEGGFTLDKLMSVLQLIASIFVP